MNYSKREELSVLYKIIYEIKESKIKFRTSSNTSNISIININSDSDESNYNEDMSMFDDNESFY